MATTRKSNPDYPFPGRLCQATEVLQGLSRAYIQRGCGAAWTTVDRCSAEVVQWPVEFASTIPVNLARSRSSGYNLLRAWADLAVRLEISGLQVDTMFTLDSAFESGDEYPVF